MSDKCDWFLAEFPYIKNGNTFKYKARIKANSPDSAIDKVWYDLELEGLDKDYMINDLVIKIRKIPS